MKVYAVILLPYGKVLSVHTDEKYAKEVTRRLNSQRGFIAHFQQQVYLCRTTTLLTKGGEYATCVH